MLYFVMSKHRWSDIQYEVEISKGLESIQETLFVDDRLLDDLMDNEGGPAEKYMAHQYGPDWRTKFRLYQAGKEV